MFQGWSGGVMVNLNVGTSGPGWCCEFSVIVLRVWT